MAKCRQTLVFDDLFGYVDFFVTLLAGICPFSIEFSSFCFLFGDDGLIALTEASEASGHLTKRNRRRCTTTSPLLDLK